SCNLLPDLPCLTAVPTFAEDRAPCNLIPFLATKPPSPVPLANRIASQPLPAERPDPETVPSFPVCPLSREGAPSMNPLSESPAAASSLNPDQPGGLPASPPLPGP